MANYNQITIIGHLTRDCASKDIAGGKKVVETGIAVNNGFGDKAKPCFVDISAWDKTGDALARLGKGEAVMIVGRLEMDQFEKDGIRRTKHRVTVERVVYLGKKEDAASVGRESASTRPVSGAVGRAFGGGSADEAPFSPSFGGW